MSFKSWYRKRIAQAQEEVIEEQLYAEKLPQKTLKPVAPPARADEKLKQFYSDTEWLQPVLNRSLLISYIPHHK